MKERKLYAKAQTFPIYESNMRELNSDEIFQIHGGLLSNVESIVFTTLSGGLIGAAAGTYAYCTATGVSAALISGIGLSLGEAVFYVALGSTMVSLSASIATVTGKTVWDYFS